MENFITKDFTEHEMKRIGLKMILELLVKKGFTLKYICSVCHDCDEGDEIHDFKHYYESDLYKPSMSPAIDYIEEWDGECVIYVESPNDKMEYWIRTTLYNEPHEIWVNNNISSYDEQSVDDKLLNEVADQYGYAIETFWRYIN